MTPASCQRKLNGVASTSAPSEGNTGAAGASPVAGNSRRNFGASARPALAAWAFSALVDSLARRTPKPSCTRCAVPAAWPARTCTTGHGPASITVTASTNLSKDDISRKVEEAKRYESEDKKRREVIDARNNADSLVYQMNECRVQSTRKRKGLDDYPCKSAGLVEYTYFARSIDDRIRTECIGCPPDPHPEEWYCAWQFTLKP